MQWKILLACALFFVAAAQTAVARKKVIELGWDIPTTAYMREHWQAMDSESPFDGVMYSVLVADGTNTYNSQWCFDDKPWRRESFQNVVQDLQSCHFTNLNHNFIRLNFSPGNVAWDDEKGWKNICEKAAILAWVAKQGGAKGLAPDFESYGSAMFKYQQGRQLDFSETAALARKRGRAFMQAVAGEFPDAVLLPLWLNSCNLQAGRSESPDEILAADHYGLLPAFINGLLDELPPFLVMVDGCESGYYQDGLESYLSIANDMKNWNGAAAALVAPENRAKYQGQVQAGFGFYLDMYLNERGNRYYFGPKEGGSRIDRLRDNLSAALEASDEYVWIYGEQCRWWKSRSLSQRVEKTAGKGALWDESLPGISQLIFYLKDPAGAAVAELAELERDRKSVNLVRNGDFSVKAENGSAPVEWERWQDEESKGQLSWGVSDNGGCARAVTVRNGCFLQKHKADEGDRFYLRGRCRCSGETLAYLRVRWQDAEEHWIHEIKDVILSFSVEEVDGWKSCRGLVVVPEGAARVVILLSALNQMSDKDDCLFDEIEMYPISRF
jgi:hypothetical protein